MGDALGGPLEFLALEEARRTHGGPVSEMIGGGWLHLRPGQTTDDTAMALALARSLDACGGHDEDDVVRRYLEWRASSPPDIGITVNAVLGAVADGAPPRSAAERFHHESDGKSAGNGSLMRIAPVAIRFRDDPTRMVEVARSESALLHFDPLAADACAWLCLRLAALVDGGPEPSADGLDPRVAEAVVPDRAGAAERATALGGFVLATLSVAPRRSRRRSPSRRASCGRSTSAATPTPTARSPARCSGRGSASRRSPIAGAPSSARPASWAHLNGT